MSALRARSPAGVNVVLDIMAGDYTARNLDVLAEEVKTLTALANQGKGSLRTLLIVGGLILVPLVNVFAQAFSNRVNRNARCIAGDNRIWSGDF